MTYRALWLTMIISWLTACTTTTSPTDNDLALIAKQGNGKAQYTLATRLASSADHRNAMHWMKQAAQQSGPLAADK